MNTKSIFNPFRMIGLCGLILLSGLTGWASVVPSPQDKVVNDFANVISDQRKAQIKEILDRVERQTGVQIALVTVPGLSDYKTNRSALESFSKTLFNDWGVGHKSVNNGVLILVAVKEGLVRFEFGSDYNDSDVAELKNIFKEKILPYFDQKDLSDALFASAMYTVRQVTVPVSFWEYHRKSTGTGFLFIGALALSLIGFSQQKKGMSWSFFVLAGVLLFVLSKNLHHRSPPPSFGGGLCAGVGITEKWANV
jgi:hypothetical protein